MSTHYLSLTDEVMWDTILQGVKANNGYSMLWDMISMHRTMPITENPFLSTKDIDKNPI